MDILCNNQLAQKELIETFIRNYKKDGKERRTRNYYEKRLKDLQLLWDEFREQHREILVLSFSKPDEAKDHIYFKQDIYAAMEEYFTSNYATIEERFKLEYPDPKPQSMPISGTKTEQSSCSKENSGTMIKLPKISLDKFNGDYRKWPAFHDLFKALVHENDALTPAQKLQYLKLHVFGEPEHLLRHFQVTDNNYNLAWNNLKERYDNKRVLVNAELKALFSQNAVSHESVAGIKGILDTTTECLQALSNLEININNWDPFVVYLVIQKLPKETHQLWEQHISNCRELPSWDTLKEFLSARFRTLEAINSKPATNRELKGASNKTKLAPQSFHVSSNVMCPMCAANHTIRQCTKFSALTVPKRLEIVRSKGLCINCLGFGHLLANCPSKRSCYHCKKNHHSLLHRTDDVNRSDPTNVTNTQSWRNQTNLGNKEVNVGTIQSTSQTIPVACPQFTPNRQANSIDLGSFLINQYPKEQILLATALVKIVAPSGHEHVVRALIDQGSQASFLTESVVQHLKLKKESISANIHGLGQSHAGQVKARVKFEIKPLHKDKVIEVSGLVLNRLTHLLPSKTISQREWDHIKDLELADPQFYQSGHIDLLLGADVYPHIIMEGLVRGKPGSPVAQKTLLGWILSGEIDNQTSQISVSTFHVCADLNEQLKSFWEIEELPNKGMISDEEAQCEELFMKGFRRFPNGRYEVKLPLKEQSKQCHLGKSRQIALRRLHQMEERFKRNERLKDEYQACIKEYLDLGHIEKVGTNEEHHLRKAEGITYYSCCYLPHHCVIKESSSTTKLRVVFDASKPTETGTSLNDIMLKGPVIQDELTVLLIRWRKYKIVFCADLEKMYRQIRVTSQDAEFQRMLWRDSPEAPIEDYKLVTVTFGTKSAPYLATRILKQLAMDEETKYPLASQITQTDFYVDDLISGADSVKVAMEIQSQLIGLMNAGGFSLRKWASNHDMLLKSIPEEMRETTLPLSLNSTENIRTLGTFWNPQTDKLSYSVKLGDTPTKWTKRTILSEVSKLFDPLGLLAPIIIIGKIIIQKLWLLGSGWDEEIPINIFNEWINYRQKMKDVKDIEISRWLNFSESNAGVEIHGFSDASLKAYAAAVYMCTKDNKGERIVSLIAAKTKVAPIKAISLPRLELCAATLLSKLVRYVVNALNIKQELSLHMWTDSQIVLAWLRAHPAKWTTFVANRVSHIHETLGQSVWNYVPSKENPADCASRGMYPNELQNHSLWWKGPDWLWKNKDFWPKCNEFNPTEIEMRKITTYHAKLLEDEELTTKYSSLTKLLRVTAYCKRFVENCKKPSDEKEIGHLKSTELNEALKIHLKRTQHQHFMEEVNALRRNQLLNHRSRIVKLTPFLDNEGLIRTGGRLRHSQLTHDEKHPIILPDKCPLTKLIIDKVHKDTMHGGPQLMMTVIAKNYWILNARNTIRLQIHNCITCYKQRAKTQSQLMGDLPAPRVRVSRPFAHTGVDYCGPFELKTHKGRNPRKYKAYIALFVCFTTKAIHLELVTDLSSEGFIAAFRRFCARRGLCQELYCDCGTNFVGANKILTRENHQMKDQLNSEIATALENQGIKFNFMPPASPHFGGLWEAGVRSTKHHLKRIIGNTTLTYEEFSTILTQIEACLNSRPLCELSNDPQDLSPLTPAHFLIGDILLTTPEPSLIDIPINRLDRWQHLQRLYQQFWKRWNSEYLCRLQQRPKWTKRSENVQVGDLVILKEENIPPCRWNLGRILETHPGPDGLVRVVTVKVKHGVLKRPITKICLLPIYNNNDKNAENEYSQPSDIKLN